MRRNEAIFNGSFCGLILLSIVSADIQRQRHQDAAAIAAYNRGVDCWKTDPELAIGEFSRAIQLDPDYERAYASRAMVAVRFGDEAQAQADLEHLQNLDSEFVATVESEFEDNRATRLALRGQEVLREGDPARAIDLLNSAIAFRPDDSAFLQLRAEAYRQAGRLHKAEADLARAADARQRGVPSLLVAAEGESTGSGDAGQPAAGEQ